MNRRTSSRAMVAIVLLMSVVFLGFVVQRSPQWSAGSRSISDVRNATSSEPGSQVAVSGPLDAEVSAIQVLAESTPDLPSLSEMTTRFEEETGPPKSQAAMILVAALDDDDDEYYDFLAARASEAISNTPPSPMTASDEPNSAFEEWISEENANRDAAMQDAIFTYPSAVQSLALTGDSRAYDILVSGLQSPNLNIVIESARGLGLIGDPAAIDLIVDAASGVSEPDVAALIAKGLLYFDDPDATEAAEAFFTSEDLLSVQLEVDANRTYPEVIHDFYNGG